MAGSRKSGKYSGSCSVRSMKRLAREVGLPTDTSQTYEYTDWDQVRAFAAQLMALAPGAPQQA